MVYNARDMSNTEHLRCVVEIITYQNTENGYTVLKCRAKNFQDLVTVVGTMPETHVGSVLSLGGSWKVNPKFGRQFEVETFEETLPATVYGIEKYLGSGLIKGIGPIYAKRIVQKFGKDTLEIIDENPDSLIEVPGIGKILVERIKKSWLEQREIKNIMLFLQSHEVSTSHATKIYKAYGADSIKVVQENPYRLADDIWGMGFRTADTIASKLGFGHEKYERLRSGIIYTLNQLSNEGHCFATREMLTEKGTELLEVEEHLLVMTLDEMIRAEDVVREEEAIYLPPFFFAERGTAKRLTAIKDNSEGIKVDPEGLEERISIKTGMTYDEIQMQAILTAVQSKVLILTGGPGTGKTTTTLGIITAFREAGAKLLLAAPTGRAAKRLSEATGMEAKTIHRLLEFKPPGGYQKTEEDPLTGDVLIVDECSMIDQILMYNLLKAVPDTMTVILVGDIDQLPSVGAGNVLRDIIDSETVPVVRLTKIFRQAQTSRIVMNAHRINAGQRPDLRGGKEADFFFQEMEEPEEIAKRIVDLVKTKLPNYYKVARSDIQVLTPMQRGVIGAANLNVELQKALNPEGFSLQRGGVHYRVRDKVMQIRNDYDKDVFNGDIGTVVYVDTQDKELTVNFDGREVKYDVTELDELVLAYATTIHKSQGSEYPIVVMPISMSHYIMLQRNLIYTGITRAKKILVMVGTKKALFYSIRNVTVSERNTRLKERLQEHTAPFSEVKTETKTETKPPMRQKPRFVAFDVETPNHRNDRMSAIGITVIEDGRITEEFYTLINPGQEFDYFNVQLTGIDEAAVKDAPTFAEAWPCIEALMNSGMLVAHNAIFDLGVLKKCLKDYGIEWKPYVRYLCTVQMGKKLLPDMSHKLNVMCDHYGIELDHHQADSDSHACAEILLKFLQDGAELRNHIRTYSFDKNKE